MAPPSLVSPAKVIGLVWADSLVKGAVYRSNILRAAAPTGERPDGRPSIAHIQTQLVKAIVNGLSVLHDGTAFKQKVSTDAAMEVLRAACL